MLSILAAALALATSVPATQVEKSEPITATCSVKFPTAAEAITAPCIIMAMREGDTTGVGFSFGQGNSLIFAGSAVEEGLNVEVLMVGETPYEVEGGCLADEGEVLCMAQTPGAQPLTVYASY